MTERHLPRAIRRLVAAVFVGAVALLAVALLPSLVRPAPRRVAYADLVAAVESGRVREADVGSDEIVATLRGAGGDELVVVALGPADRQRVLDRMKRREVIVTERPRSAFGGAR